MEESSGYVGLWLRCCQRRNIEAIMVESPTITERSNQGGIVRTQDYSAWPCWFIHSDMEMVIFE